MSNSADYDRDPYAPLDAHIISVKALYCEDCGLVETSGYSDDVDAAKELAKLGWVVGEHPSGGLSPLCGSCGEGRDIRVTASAEGDPS